MKGLPFLLQRVRWINSPAGPCSPRGRLAPSLFSPRIPPSMDGESSSPSSTQVFFVLKSELRFVCFSSQPSLRLFCCTWFYCGCFSELFLHPGCFFNSDFTLLVSFNLVYPPVTLSPSHSEQVPSGVLLLPLSLFIASENLPVLLPSYFICIFKVFLHFEYLISFYGLVRAQAGKCPLFPKIFKFCK